MLNKEICWKCWSKITKLTEYGAKRVFEKRWHKGILWCKYSDMKAFPIENLGETGTWWTDAKPPNKCPYILEHTVSHVE